MLEPDIQTLLGQHRAGYILSQDLYSNGSEFGLELLSNYYPHSCALQ